MNTTHDIPAPAGATKLYNWEADGFRYFTGDRWIVNRDNRDEDVEVYVAGLQYADGRVQREIVVHQLHADEPLTIDQARQLAAAIIEAADEYRFSVARAPSPPPRAEPPGGHLGESLNSSPQHRLAELLAHPAPVAMRRRRSVRAGHVFRIASAWQGAIAVTKGRAGR